jgi:flavin-binding protein dodecin
MSFFDIITKVGTSTISSDDAIIKLLEDVQKDFNVGWFEVQEIRGRITSDKKIEFQVTSKIGIKK